MQEFERAISFLTRWLNSIALWVLFILLLLVTVDVVLRYVFNWPLVWGFEVDCILLAALVFLGMPYTGFVRGHIRIEFVASKLPLRAQRTLDILGSLLSFAIFAMIAWRGAIFAVEARELGEVTDVLRISFFFPKLFVPIGMGFLSLVFLLHFIEALKQKG